jgi:hypothetical protein
MIVYLEGTTSIGIGFAVRDGSIEWNLMPQSLMPHTLTLEPSFPEPGSGGDGWRG